MDKFQLRYTPSEAEMIAAILIWYCTEAQAAAECDQLREQAARLNHLAARARKRAAAAAGT